jgi:hypothetical protein
VKLTFEAVGVIFVSMSGPGVRLGQTKSNAVLQHIEDKMQSGDPRTTLMPTGEAHLGPGRSAVSFGSKIFSHVAKADHP